jgi:hypothetical protein
LFDLFRADLLGLIADYAVTPISDVYIELDTGDVLAQEAYANQNGTTPNVFLEVDILERALTQRAVLRATAAKILRQLGFSKILRDMFNDDVRLTDIERDELLRMVYSPKKVGDVVFDPGTSWFGYLNFVRDEVTAYLLKIKEAGVPVEEREREQLNHAAQNAQSVFEGLKDGAIQPINQYTEPEVDVQLDPHAEIMQAILKNPLKQELFMLWVEAEKRATLGNHLEGFSNEEGLTSNDIDRLNMHKLYSMLTPIFTDPAFVVDEAKYAEYMDEAENLGAFTVGASEVEGEYHGTFETED